MSVTESLDDDVVIATAGASTLSHDAEDNVISVRHDAVSYNINAQSVNSFAFVYHTCIS